MRAKFKAVISAVLSAAIIFGTLGVGAFAAVGKNPGNVTYVNPHYSNVLDESDIQSFSAQKTKPKYAATYQSYDNCVLKLREALKSRQEVITLNLISGNTDDDEDTIYYLFSDAVAHTGKPTEGDYIDWQYGGYDCEYEYPSSGRMDITFYVYYYTTAQQEAQVEKAVSNLLASLNLSGKSDYQKIKSVYDYMCDNIEYDYEHLYDESYELQYTAYGAIVDKICVCQGYSVLFYRLALEMGIDARFIGGTAAGGGHAWNIVKLGDKYYLLDSTWDAGYDTYDYFLRGSDNFLDHVCDEIYDYEEFTSQYPISENDYGDKNPPLRIVSGDAGENIKWYFNKDTGVLSFEGSGEMYDWTSSSYYIDYSPWTNYYKQIEEIKIPDGIINIGDEAFYALENVKNVLIPESVNRIGSDAFTYCNGLENIYYTSTYSKWKKISIDYTNQEYINNADFYTVVLGDVSYDEKINSTDALLVLRASTEIQRLNVGESAAADTNRDSTVNSTDALIILQAATGIITIK